MKIALNQVVETYQILSHLFVEPVFHHFPVYRQCQERDWSEPTLANRESAQVCKSFFMTFSSGLLFASCL